MVTLVTLKWTKPLTSDIDGVYICYIYDQRQFSEVNSAAVAVVSSSGLSHCQYTGAGGLVQVGGGDEDGVTIVSDVIQATRWCPNPPSPSECLWWDHSLRDSGSAGEGEAVVGSHVGETGCVGCEVHLNSGVYACALTEHLNNKYVPGMYKQQKYDQTITR